MINSSLLTAQQRKRLYWTNLKVKQPSNKKIYLKDIIESGFIDRDKSYCIDASYFKGGDLKQYFEKGRRQVVFEKTFRVGHFNKGSQADRVYSVQGKSVSLSSNGGGRGANTGLYLIPQETNIGKWSILIDGEYYYIRKLTPKECERLQGFPDNYTDHTSNTQRYRALGNAFTVPVIEHILRGVNV